MDGYDRCHTSRVLIHTVQVAGCHRQISDAHWRTGPDEYLIPVCISSHTIIGLEWLVSDRTPEEHKRTRRYNLSWMGPVDETPSRADTLETLAWIERWIERGFDCRPDRRAAPCTQDAKTQQKALCFLRHTQRLVGEQAVLARLAHADRTEWK